MSEEQLKAFLEKVKTDTSLQEKLKAAASPEEAALEIAQEAGFSITSEDIQKLSEPIELSDEELETVAGGCKGVNQSNWNEAYVTAE